MSPSDVLNDLRARGYTAALNGDKLKLRGPCRPPADLDQRIADCREELIRILREEASNASSDTVNVNHPLDCPCMDCSARAPSYAKPIERPGEVLELAREHFGLVEEPVIPPPLPGRDPLVAKTGGKVEFFGRGDGWRRVSPVDFKVYKGGKA
jgi:hypothetical protein